ncbi:MAG: YdiU family protein [Candidatus Pristimantibacillus lignocellulolyticus]|uniref:Protein nucleotidyltransferase YdiU n=1 Tax=Candidatus Pristimantibacillus lignocellulolyticus TaxID=2994561 RepID=A0A9J6ZI64_9BACL|nr:MAG: YdiU family protein [Candidatus Pristimantibacillus lignocellulolyticus]
MTNNDEIVDAGWNFDNSYVELPQSLYTIINPTPVSSPKLIIMNGPLANALGLDEKALVSDKGVATLAGNIIPDDAIPLAQAYAGHQFGHFNRLGDGRAILLSEQITPLGERVDIQLKGSGPTPYSRRGDGRAALGPMLREYIISEAMHGLGIATTRSLAVVATGESVVRETNLPGAVLARIAASHLRVGTFEYVSQWGNDEELKQLADYTIKRHYSYIATDDNRYLHLLEEVIKRQAHLIAQWQLVGFIHGVMNTDNMAISGETIDYGPCAFMDNYDPATVFSSIDREGRYAYGNQPYIGSWNLSRFAETLLPLLHDNHAEAVELAQTALSHYATEYYDRWLAGMRAKLGLYNEEEQDESLIKDLLGLMHKYEADYTNTFIALTFNKLEDTVLVDKEEFQQWYTNWQERLKRQSQIPEDAQQLMRHHNPAIIARNHRVEEALEAAVKHSDYTVMTTLLEALSNPYEHSAKQAVYAALPEEECGPYRTFCGT